MASSAWPLNHRNGVIFCTGSLLDEVGGDGGELTASVREVVTEGTRYDTARRGSYSTANGRPGAYPPSPLPGSLHGHGGRVTVARAGERLDPQGAHPGLAIPA